VEQLLPSHDDYEKVRQNPDNNLLIYSDHGEYTLPIFDDEPKTLRDVVFKNYNKHSKSTPYSKLNKNEHPNETFAYHITDSILNGNVDAKIQLLL
jgi:hypothetical protein